MEELSANFEEDFVHFFPFDDAERIITEQLAGLDPNTALLLLNKYLYTITVHLHTNVQITAFVLFKVLSLSLHLIIFTHTQPNLEKFWIWRKRTNFESNCKAANMDSLHTLWGRSSTTTT